MGIQWCVKKRIRLGAEDLGFGRGHVELEMLLRASGGGDRKATVGFSNMDITGNFKESQVSEAMRSVWRVSGRSCRYSIMNVVKRVGEKEEEKWWREFPGKGFKPWEKWMQLKGNGRWREILNIWEKEGIINNVRFLRRWKGMRCKAKTGRLVLARRWATSSIELQGKKE